MESTQRIVKNQDGTLCKEIYTRKFVKSDEFVQVYLQDISGITKISGSLDMYVLLYLCKISTYKNDDDIGNKVVINKEHIVEITKQTDSTESTIRNSIYKLKKLGLIISKEGFRGVYFLNPVFLFKGSVKDRVTSCKKTIEYVIKSEDNIQMFENDGKYRNII